MPKYAKCVVPHCGHAHHKNPECIYAAFPREFARCKEWVQKVGVEDLTYLPIEKLRGIRYVCGCHFTVDQFINSSTKKRLKKTAVPSVLDPRIVPLTEELMLNFLCSGVVKIPTKAKKVSIPEEDLENIQLMRAPLSALKKPSATNQKPARKKTSRLHPHITPQILDEDGADLCPSLSQQVQSCEIIHSPPPVMEHATPLEKPESTDDNNVYSHTPMESLNMIEHRSPVSTFPLVEHAGCSKENTQNQLTPQRPLNQYHTSSMEIAGPLNTPRRRIISNRKNLRTMELSEKITEPIDQTTSPEKSEGKSAENAKNQSTPKRGIKRKYQVSTVRRPESLILSSDHHHGIIHITITLPGQTPDSKKFQIKNLDFHGKEIMMKKMEDIIDSLRTASQILK